MQAEARQIVGEYYDKAMKFSAIFAGYEVKQSIFRLEKKQTKMDCFVAALIAMTTRVAQSP
jgi:hypothetical protein